jgi:aldehyde dehydrogenase (NAD+)
MSSGIHWARPVYTAFNFPAAVWAWNAFIAAVCGTLSCGNHPRRPHHAIAIQRIVNRTQQTGGSRRVPLIRAMR